MPSMNDPEDMDLYGLRQPQQSVEQFYPAVDSTATVRAYLDEIVPEEIKETELYKQFWAVISRNLKFSFLNEDDVELLELYFSDAVSTFIMGLSPSEYTFETMQLIDQMRIYFRTAINRAVGFERHRFNERMIHGQQLSQIVRSNVDRVGGEKQESFFSKLFKI